MKTKLIVLGTVLFLAQLLRADTVRFTESLVDRLITVNDPDIGPTAFEETTRTGSVYAVLTLLDLDPNTLTDETPLEVTLGGWNFSKTIGEADISGTRSVTFIQTIFDDITDREIEVGRLTFSYASNVVTVAGSSRILDESVVASNYADGEAGPFQGATEASIRVGDYLFTRTLYYKGTHTVTRRVVGTGDEAQEFFLDNVQLAGQTDDIRPTAVILSPHTATRLSDGMLTVTARASDNNGVDSVYFSINRGEEMRAEQLDGTNLWSAQLSLVPGTNVIRATSVDVAGNASLSDVVTVFHVFPLSISYDSNRGTVMGVSNGQYLIPGVTYGATAKAKPAFVFTDWSGDISTNNATVSFIMEPNRALVANFIPNPTIPPTVVILAPRSGARFSNQTAIVTLRATDNNAVDHLELTLNGRSLAAAEPAPGTNLWTSEISLDPGTNRIGAVSVDVDGNRSVPALVVVTNLFPLNLSYDADKGLVMGVSDGQYLIPGVTYKATAKPNSVSLFTGWSGDVTTNSVTLRFRMERDTTLQADFVTNPWIPVKGAYHGLFCAGLDANATNSGAITLTLNERGGFTGKIQHQGTIRPFSGSFSLSNQTSYVQIARGPALPLQMGLELNPGEATVNGHLGDAPLWDSPVRLARTTLFAGTNTTSRAGKYTFTIPGAGTNSANNPGGDGVGTIVVSPKGGLAVSGTLGDGTPFTQTSALVSADEFPMFAALHGGRGLLLGWVTFEVASESHDLEAVDQLKWIKPASPSDRYYPDGFNSTNSIFGARYAPPGPRTNVLNWTNGQVAIGGGNLSEMMVIPVTLSNNVMRVEGANTNNLAVTFALPTGLFNGTFKHPVTGKPAAFKGAVVQTRPASVGPGWFLGTNQSGFIFFNPNSPGVDPVQQYINMSPSQFGAGQLNIPHPPAPPLPGVPPFQQ